MFKIRARLIERRYWNIGLHFIIIYLTLSGLNLHGQDLGNLLRNEPIDFVDTNDLKIQSKLVELALTGPRYKSSFNKLKIDELQLQKAKNAWLNLLTISFNYNLSGALFANQDGTNNVFYPRSFIGVTIPLGIILSRGSDIKIRKESIELTTNSQLELERSINEEIISNYLQYKNFRRLLIMQSRVIDVLQATFLQTEKKFTDGIISYSDYNTAIKNLNDEISVKMNLQLQQDLLKLNIERQIGVPLESVLKNNVSLTSF